MDGNTNPSTAAASITPAANERIMSENLWDIFLKIKPTRAPTIVAPPTPRAVNRAIFKVFDLPNFIIFSIIA